MSRFYICMCVCIYADSRLWSISENCLNLAKKKKKKWKTNQFAINCNCGLADFLFVQTNERTCT